MVVWRRYDFLHDEHHDVVKTWKQDKPFVAWLLQSEYATRDDAGKLRPFLTEGQVIFMWEAWLAGRATLRDRPTAKGGKP